MKPLNHFALVLVATAALLIPAKAQDVTKPLPPVADKTGVTYEADAKAIIDKSCVKCHSGDKPKARLHMDTLAGILKGSRNGPVVVPGNSSKSMIILAAAHATDDEMEWMPPTKAAGQFPQLTAAQIGLLRAWIDQGAK